MPLEQSNVTLADLPGGDLLPEHLEADLRSKYQTCACGAFLVKALNVRCVPYCPACNPRVAALEELWAAWKDVTDAQTGYTPRFTAACKRLRELEKQP